LAWSLFIKALPSISTNAEAEKEIVREGRMKLNKARRLSLRVPVIGWEAYISTEILKNTRAKIANVSADGAYLITSESALDFI
jgi:hypothetical protein